MSASSSSDNALALENFRPLMEKLVDQHHRQFTRSLSLSISWEEDDTNAYQDVANFQAILRLFGFTKAEEYVISAQAGIPGWDVGDKIRNLVRQAMTTTGRTIILIHYAGHGVNWNENLHFCNATGKKLLNVKRDMLDIVDSKSSITDSHNVDVMFLFDSCYSYLAAREYTGHNRVVEVLAAVDESSRLAYVPGLRASFTGKLYAELIKRKQSGAKNVELAELIAHLHESSPVKKPAHRILVGVNSLRLSIPEGNEASSAYRPPGPATHAVFSFRLAKSLSTDEVKAFSDWIWRLPKNIGLTLESVYETQSMCLIFRAPWAFWCKLIGLNFVQLICETKSPNLLPSTGTPSALGSKKENVHPSPSHTPGKS